MKAILASIALLPAAAAFAADAGLPPAQQELYDAERAFVRLAAEKGFRDSFYAYFADTGIAFNPHPFRVRTALAGAPPSPGPMGAAWAPVYGDISAAGDLGWDTGPLVFQGKNGAPDRHGMFFSIWKRQADGQFKVVLDVGSDTPAAVVPLDEPAQTSHRASGPAPAAVDVAAAKDSLIRRRTSLPRNGRERKPRSRLWQPALGRGARASPGRDARRRPRCARRMGQHARPRKLRASRSSPTSRSRATSATPTATTSGRAMQPEAGYYARVWKKDAKGDWRIVMDTVSPVPAGTKPLTAELMKAEEPYLEGRWAEAETAYRQYLDANPSNAFAWNRLGTSQVQQKKYADAVKSLARGIEIGGGTPVDFYNLACAHALAGQPDAALDNVERAIGAGFKKRAQYESDPDLASLRELPRFKSLMQPLE